MEVLKTAVNICIFILIISMFFCLLRFLVVKFLSDLYQSLFNKIVKALNLLKGILRKNKQ